MSAADKTPMDQANKKRSLHMISANKENVGNIKIMKVSKNFWSCARLSDMLYSQEMC